MKKFLPLVLGLCSSLALAQDSSQSEEDLWGSDDQWGDAWADAEEESSSSWDWRGFTELGVGAFRRASPSPDGNSLLESRSQLSVSGYLGETYLSGKFELLLDDVDDDKVQLLTRELYLDHSLSDKLSVRLGRQILTWGTGDFVFLNDFFPKDWQSMFSGREDDYLKAPSNSLKISYFGSAANLDLVWTPELSADSHISGERFAYYNPMLGRPVVEPRVVADEPEHEIHNGQLALRLSATKSGVEYAAYAYRGFYTQPNSVNPETGRNYYASLNAYGASLRTPLGKGILNTEFAYWDSRDDSNGANSFIPNSQLKYLIGYEQELFANFTAGAQWYTEQTLDFDAAKANATPGFKLANKWHHNATLRLTYMTMEQKLTWSLFAFYSPDENDFYLKPKITYRRDDHWTFIVGANEFGGGDLSQEWGQFKPSSNVYARVKYTF
ncbi:MAG: hypothetical protein OIF35_08635 [Cellvibrionaceae bacterium]|nr:hypothetical protein [Cellvibrionaceae bacterium]